MLYIVCPTCCNLLGDKQLIYEAEMKKVCHEEGLDFNAVSKGLHQTEKYKEKRTNIVNKLIPLKKSCCRTALITYVKVSTLIVPTKV